MKVCHPQLQTLHNYCGLKGILFNFDLSRNFSFHATMNPSFLIFFYQILKVIQILSYHWTTSGLILSIHRYMLMSPSIQQMRSYTWLKRHLPPTVVLQVLQYFINFFQFKISHWTKFEILNSNIKEDHLHHATKPAGTKYQVLPETTFMKAPLSYNKSPPPSAQYAKKHQKGWRGSSLIKDKWR